MISTLEEFKAFAKISTAENDAKLIEFLRAAQQFLENKTDRKFEKTQIQKTFFGAGNSIFIAPPLEFADDDFVKIDGVLQKNEIDFFVNSELGEIIFNKKISRGAKVEIQIQSGFPVPPADLKLAVWQLATKFFREDFDVKSKKLGDLSIEFCATEKNLVDEIVQNYKIISL